MAVNGQEIVDYLKQFIGTPYQWGGNSLTSGVDCSGMVQQAYQHFGLSVARTTYDQIGQGKAVASAAEAVARNPGAAATIQTLMVLGLAFIESLALFTLVIIFLKA